MAAITWPDVVALSPSASTSVTSTAIRDDILATVNEWFRVDLFGSAGEDSHRLRLLRIYLAAHFAEMLSAGRRANSGPVSSESISAESLSVSYASLGAAGSLESTSYGQMVRELAPAAARAPRVLVGEGW